MAWDKCIPLPSRPMCIKACPKVIKGAKQVPQLQGMLNSVQNYLQAHQHLALLPWCKKNMPCPLLGSDQHFNYDGCGQKYLKGPIWLTWRTGWLSWMELIQLQSISISGPKKDQLSHLEDTIFLLKILRIFTKEYVTKTIYSNGTPVKNTKTGHLCL